MNTVFIVPTGVGAEVGGHCGDATPAVKMIAGISDIVITHPNVLNAADIIEIPENVWYVEGSMLDKFLNGKINLTQPKFNRIILAVNKPIDQHTQNMVGTARAVLGADIKIVELNTELKMMACFNEQGLATGLIDNDDDLIEQLAPYQAYDAIAIQTIIQVQREIAFRYLREGGVNPWGGVEAILSRYVSEKLHKPVAHAPLDSGILIDFKEVVDPRSASEAVGTCCLYCILRGLHKCPRIAYTGQNITTVLDVDALISPYGVWGTPHTICKERGIPLIMVKENSTVLNIEPHKSAIVVDNYHEAAGIIACMKAGITKESVRRPFE